MTDMKQNYLSLMYGVIKNEIGLYLILTQFGCSGGTGGLVTDSSKLTKPTPCTINTVSSQPCVINQSNIIITKTIGDTINQWSVDPSLSKLIAKIPNGIYSEKKILFEDSNLNSSNIKAGINIFGVKGTFESMHPNCADDQFNSEICSTKGNRYITSSFGINVNVSNAQTALISKGYYDGSQRCNISDANLVAENIKLGTKILGINGTLITPYPSCTINNFNSELCTTDPSRYVSANLGSAISNWTNLNSSTSVSGKLSNGFYANNTSISFTDSALISSNIKLGKTLFNVRGSYFDSGIPLSSNAFHDKTSNPILQTDETSIYVGANLPNDYREVPIQAKDTAVNTNISRANDGTWNTGAPRKVCGKGVNTSILGKIADCYSQHTVKPNWDDGVTGKISWNGMLNGNAGQGTWILVSVYSSTLANGTQCDASCTEVWRDDRTGLLWSDLISNSTNWCLAAGNADSDDPRHICDQPTYQSSFPTAQSWCAESATVTEVTDSAENWSTGIYHASKGAMGKNTPVSVRWRLPTKYDLEAADINGINYVLPIYKKVNNYYHYIWTASSLVNDIIIFSPTDGEFILDWKDGPEAIDQGDRIGFGVICVGR